MELPRCARFQRASAMPTVSTTATAERMKSCVGFSRSERVVCAPVLMGGAQRTRPTLASSGRIFSRRFEPTKAVIRALREGSAYGVTLSSG